MEVGKYLMSYYLKEKWLEVNMEKIDKWDKTRGSLSTNNVFDMHNNMVPE